MSELWDMYGEKVISSISSIRNGTPITEGDLKPTSELIHDIVGFDMSKIKMPKLPEYKESEK